MSAVLAPSVHGPLLAPLDAVAAAGDADELLLMRI
jgi:hypothetical protein